MTDQMTGMICVPITETVAPAFLDAIAEAAGVADAIELRLDYLADESDLAGVLSALPERFATLPKPLIFTHRPREQGGRRELSLDERARFWRNLPESVRACISYADFELDLAESFAASESPIPWSRVICSSHNFAETPADLHAVFDRIARTPAAVIKIATKASRIADCLPVLSLIEKAASLPEQRQVIALGMGLPGMATRVLSPSRGAMLTFGALRRGAESASGQPTADELRKLYRADKLTRDSLVMGVVGNPVGHSRSPLIHNTALAALGIDGVYLPFEVADIAEFIRDFVHPRTRNLDWQMRGLSVTIPHKLSIMPHMDFIDPVAQRIGAVNTLVVAGNELHGYNTDVIGAMKPLEEMIDVRGARVAVLGAGGAARAICYGLQERTARITILARNLAKARLLADEFDAEAASLEDFRGEADIVINCTPVGMSGHDENHSPVRAEQLRNVRLVYDLIYNPLETALLKEAGRAGCATLGGMAMLIGQAAEQFRLWTTQDAPADLMMTAALAAAG